MDPKQKKVVAAQCFVARHVVVELPVLQRIQRERGLDAVYRIVTNYKDNLARYVSRPTVDALTPEEDPGYQDFLCERFCLDSCWDALEQLPTGTNFSFLKMKLGIMLLGQGWAPDPSYLVVGDTPASKTFSRLLWSSHMSGDRGMEFLEMLGDRERVDKLASIIRK